MPINNINQNFNLINFYYYRENYYYNTYNYISLPNIHLSYYMTFDENKNPKTTIMEIE